MSNQIENLIYSPEPQPLYCTHGQLLASIVPTLGRHTVYTYPLFEGVSLLHSEGVRLANDRHNVDTVVQALHELNINWAETRERERGEGGGGGGEKQQTLL